MKFYAILKKNKELNDKITDARKIGIQTLIDKLLQIFQYQEVENPNQILWIREKTKFCLNFRRVGKTIKKTIEGTVITIVL